VREGFELPNPATSISNLALPGAHDEAPLDP
jgi:hypothetical protein